MAAPASVLWQRLDAPGSDACRVTQDEEGWQIDGSAAFLHEGHPACLSYVVQCDRGWRTTRANVAGWTRRGPVALSLSRDAGNCWMLNGASVPQGRGLCDLDLGFTPATNTSAIRRLHLAIGEREKLTALWLDPDDLSLKPLVQLYHRLDADRYAYQSPAHGFAAELRTDADGLVRDYPGLWRAETG